MNNDESASASTVRMELPSNACPGKTETKFEHQDEIEARCMFCAETGFSIGAMLLGSRLLAILASFLTYGMPKKIFAPAHSRDRVQDRYLVGSASSISFSVASKHVAGQHSMSRVDHWR